MAKVLVSQVDAVWLAERLHDWPDGSGPMYQRLAQAIERLVQAGEVQGGARLPAERLLSTELKVSRTTVAGAYELLADRRLVTRRHGSGTYVESVRTETPPPRESVLMRSLERNEIFDGLLDPPRELLDMRSAVIHDSPGLPQRAMDAMAADVARASSLQGYVPAGLPALRAAIAARYTALGLPTEPGEVLVTSGAQQALALIAMLHVRPDDEVVTEALTHTGAIDLFIASGARLRTVPVGQQGADVDAIERVLAERPRLLYLIPSIHNPLGSVMPARERRRLASLLEEHPDLVVIADDTLADTYRDRRPPPPLGSYPGAHRVLHTGSLSKLIWGGLRVGWVRGPVPEIRRLARLKALTDLGSSIPSQLLAIRLMEEGEDFADERRAMITQRGRTLERALAHRLPSWSFDTPEGGLCLWIRLPGGSARDLTMRAARHGVALAAGSIQSPQGHFSDHLRIPYSHSELVLTRAVDRLAEAWEQHADPSPICELEDLRVVV